MRALIITCEHAGNLVPEIYRHLFSGKEEVLVSHRGWDPGALPVAQALAVEFMAPLFLCTTSRLLIEANRSMDAADLYSEFTRGLSSPEKGSLLHSYYLPFREAAEEQIRTCPLPVLHLSIHTFTPVWQGQTRQVDIGLLFDPSRKSEGAIAAEMQRSLSRDLPNLRIQFNEPYLGTDDGFTTFLRTRYEGDRYAGLEIEINQKYQEDSVLTIVPQLSKAIKGVLWGSY